MNRKLAKTVREMLDDVEAVTKGRFYEDPEPYASPIEMFLIRDGRPGGETFAHLSNREKLQVLDYYVRWQEHQDRGISFEQMEQVFSNVIEGKPRAQWLDGTGLDGKPVKDQKLAMKTLLEEASKQVKQAMKAKDRGGVER